MSVAFLFPGQGSDRLGMGLDVAARSVLARAPLDHASRSLGLDVATALARSDRALSRTEVLQPAIVAVSLAALHELQAAGVRARWVAGHSLGEISAWCGSGAIRAEDAIELAVRRARILAREAALRSGGMFSVDECDRATLEDVLAAARAAGLVDVAAQNGPRQWVVAGEDAALAVVERTLAGRRLPIPGPWHSRMMSGAVTEVRALLRAVPRRPATAAFIANRTGDEASPEEVADLLAEQVVSPARWSRCLETLAKAGATTLVTVGPGKVLRYTIRRTLGASVRVLGTEDAADLERTIEALAP